MGRAFAFLPFWNRTFVYLVPLLTPTPGCPAGTSSMTWQNRTLDSPPSPVLYFPPPLPILVVTHPSGCGLSQNLQHPFSFPQPPPTTRHKFKSAPPPARAPNACVFSVSTPTTSVAAIILAWVTAISSCHPPLGIYGNQSLNTTYYRASAPPQ